jgi:hypothetical protein
MNASLANYAPLNSPSLTGVPLTPSPPFADNGGAIVNTNWVQGHLANYLPLTGGTLTGQLTVNTQAVIGPVAIVSSSNAIYPTTNNFISCGEPGSAWFQVAAYAFPNESDPRLKQDMTPAPAGALDKVQSLGVHQFRYKTDPTRRLHVGFNANELETLHPHAVFIGKDEAGTKAINLPDMIALLWQAVQELAARVEALEAGR